MSIVKSNFFGANFTGSLPIWADGIEAHKTALICINIIESKYQWLNKCKLLFDLVVHQQQNLQYIVSNNILVHLAKFKRNSTKRNFYIETEGVIYLGQLLASKVHNNFKLRNKITKTHLQSS